jgi:hypothetical protein
MSEFHGLVYITEEVIKKIADYYIGGFISSANISKENSMLDITWKDGKTKSIPWRLITDKVGQDIDVHDVYEVFLQKNNDLVGIMLKGTAEKQYLKPIVLNGDVYCLGMLTAAGIVPK